MGLSLGSIVGAITDPGGLVKDAINTVLPKNLAIVGDIAGAYVDFQTGNGLGAAKHAMDALKDLPQAMNALQSTTARCGSQAFEPTPPPVRPNPAQLPSANWQPGTALGTSPGWRGTAINPSHTLPAWQASVANATHTVAQAASAQTQGLSGLTQFAQALEKALKLLQDALKQFGPAASGNLAPKPDATKPEATKPEATSTSTKPSSTDAADDDATSTKSTSSSSSKKSTSTDSSKKTDSDTTATLKKLDKMSDVDFMAALREGKIPDDVMKDPKAMMAIQQRMNQISEMTKLMTSMMQALHDMQMSIIQNVRV